MDPTILASIIGAVAILAAAIIGVRAGIKIGRKGAFDYIAETMDAVIDLLRESMKAKKQPPKAFSLVRALLTHYSLNNVIAALYLLREQKIINWEDANILKPNHRIELTIH